MTQSAKRNLVEARTIPFGGFFRKKTGTYVYLRVSESSVKFHNLDKNKVYGITHNGNLIHVSPDKKVYPCSINEFVEVFEENIRWHAQICRKVCTCEGDPTTCEVHLRG